MQDEESPLGLDSFRFSFEQGKDAKKDLDLRINALQARINNITQRVVIKDMRVVDQILHQLMAIEPSAEDIILVGKAIQRVGELMPELENLKKRHAIVKASLEEPNWLMAAFADFTDDFPNGLSENADEFIQGLEQ